MKIIDIGIVNRFRQLRPDDCIGILIELLRKDLDFTLENNGNVFLTTDERLITAQKLIDSLNS